MKKIYQDKFGEGGNCMQAAMASLFEVELWQTPNFIDYKEHWERAILDFPRVFGYEEGIILYNSLVNKNVLKQFTLDNLKNYEGVNGLFYASIGSPKYWKKYKWTHAVIIDKKFNIVHDPHPEYKDLIKYPDADKIGYNGIREVTIHTKV